MLTKLQDSQKLLNDEFVLITMNSIISQKEFYDTKEEIKNSNDKLYIKQILSYCLKCRKNTESKNPKAVKTKNWRIMLLSKCTVCNSKKSEFTKRARSYRIK